MHMTVNVIQNLGSSVDGTLIKVFFTKKKSINQTNNIARRLETAPHSTVNLLKIDIMTKSKIKNGSKVRSRMVQSVALKCGFILS